MLTFTQIIDLLLKGAGHKYIKRIPYNTPKGRRYRYIYNVTHSHRGKHAMDESHLVEGTKFMVHTESGKEVHGHITSVNGNNVTYEYDDGPNKGKSVTASKSEIVSMLNEKHNVNEQVQAKRDKLKADIEQARKTGSEKQIARLESQLKRLGGGEPAKPAKPKKPAKPAKPKKPAKPAKSGEPIVSNEKINLADLKPSDVKFLELVSAGKQAKSRASDVGVGRLFNKIYADGNGNILTTDGHRVTRIKEANPTPASVLVSKKTATHYNNMRKEVRERHGDGSIDWSLTPWDPKKDYTGNEIIKLSKEDDSTVEQLVDLQVLDNQYANFNNIYSVLPQTLKYIETAITKNKPIHTFDKNERKRIVDDLKSYMPKIKTVDKQADRKRESRSRVMFHENNNQIEMTLIFAGGSQVNLAILGPAPIGFKPFALSPQYLQDALKGEDVTLSSGASSDPVVFSSNTYDHLIMPSRLR